jgi:hypothetical protein
LDSRAPTRLELTNGLLIQLLFCSAFSAYTLKIKPVIGNSKSVLTQYLLFQTEQPVFHNLFYASAFRADQVVMVMGAVGAPQIKASSSITKVDFLNHLKIT